PSQPGIEHMTGAPLAETGLAIRDCGGSPLAGCQGQGMPGVEVRVRDPGGLLVATVHTEIDGYFSATIPPGSYTVEDTQSGRSVAVDVRADEVTPVELPVP